MHTGSEFQLGLYKTHSVKICGGQRVSEIVLEGNLNQADARLSWEAMFVIHLLWSGKQVSISGDSSEVW